MENTEKNEQEISGDSQKNEDVFRKKKMNFRFELTLFFILGFLLGVVIKTEAVKRITIGFNDNLIISQKQSYDIEKIKGEIAKEAEAQNQAAQEAQVPQGNSPEAETNQ
jgi:hypothetical protein